MWQYTQGLNALQELDGDYSSSNHLGPPSADAERLLVRLMVGYGSLRGNAILSSAWKVSEPLAQIFCGAALHGKPPAHSQGREWKNHTAAEPVAPVIPLDPDSGFRSDSHVDCGGLECCRGGRGWKGA
ncbi:hypothetical protein CapIbe_021237 [Capra ibex]